MSEVPLSTPNPLAAGAGAGLGAAAKVRKEGARDPEAYMGTWLTRKHLPPGPCRRTMGEAFSYERGTPVHSQT